MDQKFEITFDKDVDHILIMAQALDGSEEIKKVFPLSRVAEADKFFHVLQDARCLRGFTKVYAQGAKQRAETKRVCDKFFADMSQKIHDQLWTPEGVPRSMCLWEKTPDGLKLIKNG
ncbi:MAG: hypothetical protein ACLQO6_02820 [Desulfomonilaceae bacterium]